MRLAHPTQFLGDQARSGVPVERDERLVPAQRAAGAIAVQPAAASRSQLRSMWRVTPNASWMTTTPPRAIPSGVAA